MRYVSIPKRKNAPRADGWWEDTCFLPDVRIYENDDPQETGLLDHRGNPLYRVKERGKLGF